MIELKKISILDDNMKECIELEVATEQKDSVMPNSINLAYAYNLNARGTHAVPQAIYADGKMVGLITYVYRIDDKDFGETCYSIWPFMIDKNHQGKGYGKQAMQKVLDEIRTMPHGKADNVFASYEPENEIARKLYASLGFENTDKKWADEDDTDIIARLSLK